MTAPPRPLPALLVALLLGACGGGGDDAATPAAPPIDASEESVDAVADHLRALGREKEAARRAGDARTMERLERAMQEIERAQDAAMDAQFATTPFEDAVDQLPLRRPPLFVEQLLLEDGTHDLVVRVKPRRFLCGLTAAERTAAVRGYFEAADRIMRKAGIDDFALTVDGVRETGEVRPLARAGERGVSLTRRGRDTSSC